MRLHLDFKERGSEIPVSFNDMNSDFAVCFEEFYGVSSPDDTKTFILVDEDGNEVPAVLVKEETVFNATANDIREGCVAATDKGITVGEKFIPPYYTSVGWRLIPAGSEFLIPLPKLDAYDYTALQCIICPYNNSISGSVSAEKVAIEDNVYAVNSASAISAVTKDAENKSVKFGIFNDSDVPYIVRYFTYKEEI